MSKAIPKNQPVYQQLHDQLRALISRKEFAIGAKFLSERQIAERFSVSRPTANKVLVSLMNEGVLHYEKGVGTFVQEPVLSYDLQDLVSFTEKAQAIGKPPSTIVLSFESLTASTIDQEIMDALGLAQSAPVFYVERLRLADDEPHIFEQRYIVADMCPELNLEQLQSSLYTLWTEVYDLNITGADQCIRAIVTDDRLAGQLQVPSGSACFQVQCTGYVESGRALWWERTTYRGDNYQLLNKLGDQDDGQPVHGVLF